ncbi:ATG8-interacting protein 1 [Sesamum indicum]|uniref:ATG8-interacting protein 1 n=1 Tax=Sesamum indicum TaxID=4182 RepID=A0A6I9TFN7_SESIN|nr:ATG8-interacting protein 1 [Sesamum indicum]XP_011082752.1 ATG8-interacting protein 1 [Sesamum indicum]XP_011082753.1 ATG8-interacting protein 1 [Sesamum indicum]XP_020550595.1 ATG8-interacting protein 1 [Sesamum indicum]
MADNKEGNVTAARGNDWEVVSLTASAYAAGSSSEQIYSSHDSQRNLVGEHEAETSSAMFMSGHFVFPPSQHENLPLEPEYNEIHNEKGSEDDVSQLVKEERVKSDVEHKVNIHIKGLMSNEFPGIQIFDEKGNIVSVSGADFGGDATLDEMQSVYGTAEFSPLHCETTMGKSSNIKEGEGTDYSIEPLEHALGSGLPNFQKPVEGDKCDGAALPCEAWWKRQAFSLYTHAKEANTVWSIFVAAAVMGLVIIGQRWQVLHLKWQFGISDERMGRLLGPISRFKDVIVGGHRRGSLVRGSTSAEL